MGVRVLVTDYAWESLDIERGVLRELGAELVVAGASDDELVRQARDADAILTNWRRLPREALEAATRCAVVSRYGVGVDNIPVESATELGIVVTNVPDFCLDEVSDHAFALLLACARRIVPFARSTAAGEWRLLELGHGLARLRGQVLGLVGFGNVARSLVPKARAFGLEVLAYTPRLQPGVADGVETTNDVGDLLARSDYVSLHAPARPETQGLIGEAELQRMKPTAYLINTSRGALVDEQALRRAVGEGWIAGAGLDVLAQEPPPAGHPLIGVDGIVVTPHAAFYSEQSIAELQHKAAGNVAAVLGGQAPATVVNRAVLDTPQLRMGRPA